MSGANQKFTLVQEDATAVESAQAKAATQMFALALRALSARAMTAVSDLFSLVLVSIIGALAYHILDNPTQYQIVTVFGFAGFCVVIDVIRRRTK